MLKLLVLAGLVAFANARCANQCSGHGQCGANDRCTCYSAWEGSDCSQRSCPHGHAWIDTASATDTAHNYAECSNRGTCDRKTGLCGCADGYTGMACARTTCPSDCNGHGTCETIAELAVDTSMAVGGKTHATYGSWDGGKTRGCKCDPRYTGHDCSARMCPRGDDPLTTEVDISQTETTSLQVVEVQNVTVQSVNAPINGGQVTFTYTDLYNAVWTTRPVDLPLVKTWNNKNGKLQTSAFNWQTTGLHVGTFGTYVQLDTTTGEHFVENTLNAAASHAVASFQLRKGDVVQIGATAWQTNGGCMCRIYADVGNADKLKCIVDVGVAGTRTGTNALSCKNAATAAGATVYSAWSVASPGAVLDGTKDVTTYVSATGAITTEATGTFAQAVTATTRSPLSDFIPGQWVRVYDFAAGDGSFCDFQINAHPTANTGLNVDPNSATSTKVDSSTGIGNSGGSVACTDFSGKTWALAQILNFQSIFAKSGNSFPKVETGMYTYTSTLSNSVVTFTRSTAFAQIEADAMQAGAIAHVYNDAANDGSGAIQFKCMCRISSYIADGVSTSFQCVDTGTVAGATFTQCSAALVSSKGLGIVITSNNGIIFDPSADDSANNPGYFTGLQAGDQVALTNHNIKARDTGLVFTIESVDSTLGRAIYFKTGSAPNGGGMYPIVPNAPNTRVAASAAHASLVPVANVALDVATVVQAVHTANCAANWCATDAATSNSAKDVARVLHELPNQVLEDVTVAMTSNALHLYAYTLTFGGARNSGDQHSIIMNGKGCNIDGCQPRYSGVRTQTAFMGSCTQTASTLACASEKMLLSEGMSATGGEELVLYQAGANNGAKFTAATTVDATSTFTTSTASTVSVAASTGVIILRASGEWSTQGGGSGDAGEDAVQDGVTHTVQKFKSVTYEITRGTTESTECSGRGNCDSETGLCECTEGYTGEACGTQSVLV